MLIFIDKFIPNMPLTTSFFIVSNTFRSAMKVKIFNEFRFKIEFYHTIYFLLINNESSLI